jgi:succinoglycan biosynthesis protein ExoL
MMDYSWDIVFMMAGTPLPSQLQMAAFAQSSGLKTLMIVLQRRVNDLRIDKALVNFDLKTIEVPFKSVDFKRVTSMPEVYRKLKTIILEGLKPDGIVVTSSYDLLLFARVMSVGRKYNLRHEVSDMNSLQLSGSAISRIFTAVEWFLLRKVDRVMVRSPEFIDKYYNKIYKGKKLFVANVPARRIWMDFQRKSVGDNCFRIGFIGIIRYRESMRQLIVSVKKLAAEGLSVKVIFAGGGADWLKDIPEYDESLIEFYGAYEYTRDIKQLYSQIDLVYAVYDSYDRNCQLAMPTKYYECIISKIPILVAQNTFVEREVLRLGIGASVLSGNVEGLVDLLRKAIVSGDWYKSALERLRTIDANTYFDELNEALRESVMP